MATPDSPEAGPADVSDPHSPTLPGHTVDKLRAQGKATEARAEFERLLQQGVESGIDSRSPTAIFDSIRADIRARTSTSSGDIQGSQE
jgi:hypothetical protein